MGDSYGELRATAAGRPLARTGGAARRTGGIQLPLELADSGAVDPILKQLAASVSDASSLEALTRPLLELLEAVTGLESTYLTTIDEQLGVQHILYARNSRQMQIPEGLSVPWHDTLCKRALDENRMYTDDVAGCWGDSEAARALGIKTYLSQPVRDLSGQIYGTLCAASAESVGVPEDKIKVLGMFAQLIAHQVERERMLQHALKSNAELSSHALTDPLTGIANRRGLVQHLRRVMEQARREQASVQVAFIDLDGFKAINDHYGHEAGDGFLSFIAGRLANCTRSSDFVARYGGDEFVVVAYNTSVEQLNHRLQQLTVGRFAKGTLSIDYAGASVGVAASAPGETDPEALLKRADAAMYATKRARKEGPLLIYEQRRESSSGRPPDGVERRRQNLAASFR